MPALVPKSAPRWFTDPIVDVLARIGITPNILTIAGAAGNIVAAVLAGSGEFVAAGLVVLAASSLDMLDGALARATGQATDFGSVFDSVMDRVSEAALLFGLLVYFSERGDRTEELLIFIAVVGSIMVSYVRARAEIVGIELKEGLFSRAPRVVLIATGLILDAVWDDSVTAMLWVLAVFASVTAVQRLALVWWKTRDRQVSGISSKESVAGTDDSA
jgi:CDP-diacylglycerol--glycerol-3-phosphate 3-phosphatidyltransferase